MNVDVPPHIVPAEDVTVNPLFKVPATVTVARAVNSTGGQTPLVARTLKVVVALSTPVDKLRVHPVPTTAGPIFISPASSRS
jgi:hypothetical protein